jgi:hypothetical protein
MAFNVAQKLIASHLVVGEMIPGSESVGARSRKEYRLTAAGTDALPVLHALTVWAQRHTQSPSGKSMRIICTTCGTDSVSGARCQTCGAELTAATTAWDRPKSPENLIELASAGTPRKTGG